MAEDDRPGVTYEVPVPSDPPPVEAAYQLIVPVEAVAPRVTDPVPQRVAGVVPVMVGMTFTVTGRVVTLAVQPLKGV